MAQRDPHYRGDYDRQRAALLDMASRHPDAHCWRDGHTLAAHPPHRDGTPATWTAGHTIDGQPGPAWLHPHTPPLAGPWLALEASTCNYANGARRSNRRRANPRSRAKLA
jgi:hypothetical protein